MIRLIFGIKIRMVIAMVESKMTRKKNKNCNFMRLLPIIKTQ